jgi:NADH pyrophosphatase NudC (nudix superfamily)
MYRGVKVTYFIVQKFDENEKLKIDENEIDQAYWMRVSEVSKNIHLLTEKNRFAWKEF